MAKQINYDKSEGLLMKNLLGQYTKPELVQKAKLLGMRGYSSKKVGELREMIADEMLAEEAVKRAFYLFTDEQIHLFEKAQSEESGCHISAEEMDDACGITDAGYALLDEIDNMLIPKDASAAYNHINGPDFHQKRREYVWLLDCFDACEAIYGVMPEEQLLRVYNSRKGYRKTLAELKAMYRQLDDSVCSMIFEDGKVISSSVYEDYKDIEMMQGAGDFYLPSVAEVLDISRHFFPSEEEACKKLIRMLQTECDKEKLEAYDIVNDIWEQFSKSYQVADVLGDLDLYHITFHSTQGMDDFTGALVELNNHTRMMIYRGYTPVEVAEAELKAQAAAAPAAKQKKVYPNDPCPCGSGRKYKHCHGRK